MASIDETGSPMPINLDFKSYLSADTELARWDTVLAEAADQQAKTMPAVNAAAKTSRRLRALAAFAWDMYGPSDPDTRQSIETLLFGDTEIETDHNATFVQNDPWRTWEPTEYGKHTRRTLSHLYTAISQPALASAHTLAHSAPRAHQHPL